MSEKSYKKITNEIFELFEEANLHNEELSSDDKKDITDKEIKLIRRLNLQAKATLNELKYNDLYNKAYDKQN